MLDNPDASVVPDLCLHLLHHHPLLVLLGLLLRRLAAAVDLLPNHVLLLLGAVGGVRDRLHQGRDAHSSGRGKI